MINYLKNYKYLLHYLLNLEYNLYLYQLLYNNLKSKVNYYNKQ